MSVHVLVTGDDEFPTWIPGALPIWTTFDLIEAFIDEHQVVAQAAELFDSDLVELFSELQQVGCTSVVVDPVTINANVMTMPIQDALIVFS